MKKWWEGKRVKTAPVQRKDPFREKICYYMDDENMPKELHERIAYPRRNVWSWRMLMPVYGAHRADSPRKLSGSNCSVLWRKNLSWDWTRTIHHGKASAEKRKNSHQGVPTRAWPERVNRGMKNRVKQGIPRGINLEGFFVLIPFSFYYSQYCCQFHKR